MNFLILLFQAIREAIKALRGLVCFYIHFLSCCFTEASLTAHYWYLWCHCIVCKWNRQIFDIKINISGKITALQCIVASELWKY